MKIGIDLGGTKTESVLLDQKGNKVIREKTKDKRTTHWVPSVQTDDFINTDETNDTDNINEIDD